jgi:acetyl-CoA acetyltransferase
MSSSSDARAAIVGVGATPYYRRGASLPQTPLELTCRAIVAALDDAGLRPHEVDGFALYSLGASLNPATLASTLGVPEVRFTAGLTGGGGGSAGGVELAAMAVERGIADVVVTVMTLQQAQRRVGQSFSGPGSYLRSTLGAESDFLMPYGATGPGQLFAILARRHMHDYGTTREHFAEVAISTRANATTRPSALHRTPLTRDEYFDARMIADPLCLFDFCLESDAAVACVTVRGERARDLRQRPVSIVAGAHGGAGRWGNAFNWMQMPDEYFASSGHRTVARRLFERAGCGPGDIDVALLYDHFGPAVIMQLEDYGFCDIGEGGPFVAEGNIRWPTGSIPVNTNGGQLSEAYVIGMTHVLEAVEQLRGSALNQVDGAELALVTGGPALVPMSAVILGRES